MAVTNDIRQISDVTSKDTNLIKQLYKATVITKTEARKRNARHFANSRRKQKGKTILPQNNNTDKKSKLANKLSQDLQNGGNMIMENNNTQGSKGYSQEGFQLKFDTIVGTLQLPLVACTKDMYIDEEGKASLVKEYAIMAMNVPDYLEKSIVTEAEFLQAHNTVAALTLAMKNTRSYKVSVVTDTEQMTIATFNYKSVRDQFITLGTFSHALNQVGKYVNSDFGISVSPVWIDKTNIGLVAPEHVENIFAKLRNLYSYNGVKFNSGLLCDDGCNPAIMTSSLQKVDVYGGAHKMYQHLYKNINEAEQAYTSQFAMDFIKPVDKNQEIKRYHEDYVCSISRNTMLTYLETAKRLALKPTSSR